MAEGIYGRDNSLLSEPHRPEPPRELFHTHPCCPKWGFQLELWGPPLGRGPGWPRACRSPVGSACSCEPSMNPGEKGSSLEAPW